MFDCAWLCFSVMGNITKPQIHRYFSHLVIKTNQLNYSFPLRSKVKNFVGFNKNIEQDYISFHNDFRV